jgi:ABC-2 type transport system ATP-binding protein
MNETAIKTISINKYFGDFCAVKNLNLEISRGEIFALLGPNGAGKTTTIKLLTSLLRPTSGRIWVNGIDPSTDPLALKKCIGLLPDSPFIYPKLTGTEYLRLVGDIFGVPPEKQRKRVPELLSMFDLGDDGSELPGHAAEACHRGNTYS